MKTTIIILLAVFGPQLSQQNHPVKSKRGSSSLSDLIPVESGWRGSSLPYSSSDIYSSGIDDYLPFQPINTADYNLKVNLGPAPHTNHFHILASNSIEKPVDEPQEIVPPQSIRPAVLPPLPPPATPVNAAASNIPAGRGAVFLGSGSLGVVNLGNGAYALGSGSLGYSGNRAQPRPSNQVPVYPPLAASPNLIPAAVPSPAPLQPIPNLNIQVPSNVDFNHPFLSGGLSAVPRIDNNGYEYLPPNRIGFGAASPRPQRLRTTQQFATPTALQLPPQIPNLGGDYNFKSSGQLGFSSFG